MTSLKPMIAFLFVHVISATAFSQGGLPSFTGTNLNNREIRIPKDVIGKKTLLGFAFSQHSQDELEGWLEPVYYEFIDTNTLAALVYDANVYLVVSLSDANAGFRDRIMKQLKDNVLKEFYAHVLITNTGPGELMPALGITDEKNLHIMTLDPLGDITFSTRGAYSDEKFEKVASYLEAE